MPTEFAAQRKSGRWAKLFGGQEGFSREALEQEAAAEIGALQRPGDGSEQEQPAPATPNEATPAEVRPAEAAPAAHPRRNPWSRVRQILSDEPADVRRERLEREAAEELRLTR